MNNNASQPNLDNSGWYITRKDSKGNPSTIKDSIFFLEKGGKLIRYALDGTLDRSVNSWTLKENNVVINIDNSFSTYVGILNVKEGGEGYIVGSAGNKKEQTWSFSARQIEAQKYLFLPQNRDIVYSKDEYNDDSVISFLGDYNKFWEIYREVKNPKFDEYSNKILRLKDQLNWAIDFFFQKLNPLIISDSIVICYVPSSTKEKLTTGVRTLSIRLSKIKTRVDGTGCIVRHTTVPKNAYGADRSMSVHLNSLQIDNKELIKGCDVLLLDDVTTTGNSLKACKKLLLEAGAKKVYCFALGQTV